MTCSSRLNLLNYIDIELYVGNMALRAEAGWLVQRNPELNSYVDERI